MTKEEFCKELKESQERGILFVCSTAQKYVNSLEAEIERLKRELKQMEVQDQVVVDTLRKENELLNDALKDKSQEHAEIKANHIERINTCTATIRKLRTENERLKGELKKWEDRGKVVKDRFDGEVYDWKGNYYIVTPYLNVFVKGLLKDNARLRCLTLLLASEMYWFKSLCNKYEGSDWWVKMKRRNVYYRKAYRKAKAELKEKK